MLFKKKVIVFQNVFKKNKEIIHFKRKKMFLIVSEICHFYCHWIDSALLCIFTFTHWREKVKYHDLWHYNYFGANHGPVWCGHKNWECSAVNVDNKHRLLLKVFSCLIIYPEGIFKKKLKLIKCLIHYSCTLFQRI